MEMKKKRNFLTISIDDGFDRALNISNIMLIRKRKSGKAMIFTVDGSRYDVEESYEEVLDMVTGRRKKDEKKT